LRTAPSINPDGEYVIYISKEELFSLEWYLADAETGEVIRSLTNTLTGPHLNALRFIDSSGSWSPDGNKIVFLGSFSHPAGRSTISRTFDSRVVIWLKLDPFRRQRF